MVRQELINVRGSRTQTEVANILGVTQKHLSKIELGQRTPSAKLLAKISEYYEQPIEVLFPDIFLTNDTPNSCNE